MTVGLAETMRGFMRVSVFGSVSPCDLPHHEGLDGAITSHCYATIMRICLCYSFNPLAEKNAWDIIGVEWQLFITHYFQLLFTSCYLYYSIVIIQELLFMAHKISPVDKIKTNFIK